MKDQLFWYARFVQAFFIFMGCFVFMPPLWAIIYLNLSGGFSHFEISFAQIITLSLIPYPKSLLTALFIGLIVALRSATWGSISLFFTILTSFIIAFIVMLVTEFLQFMWPQFINDSGFGAEFIFAWFLAWMAAGALYYWLLVFSGFYERYQANQRKNLISAFWVALTYGIFTPILYVLITAKLAFGDTFAMIAAGPIKQAQAEITAYLMATLLVFIVASLMRRFGRLTFLATIMLPIAVCVMFLLVYLLFKSNNLQSELSWFYIETFFYLAVFLILISFVVFYLCGIIAQEKTTILSHAVWFDKQQHHKKSAFLAASIVFIVMLLIAPIIWHLVNQSLLAIFIGYPPSSYMWRNIWIAYLQVGCIFSGLVAIAVFISGRLQFNYFFVAAIMACLIGSFLPNRPFLLSVGFYIDAIAWPMLSYLVLSIICWLLCVGLERLGLIAWLKHKLIMI